MTDQPTHEQRAKKLLARLERPKEEKKAKRPYFIEITGSPTSGKTTTIEILDPFFRRQRFRVFIPQEGAEVIRHIPRTGHLYNASTGNYAWRTLVDASVSANYDLVIFDRCLYDACAWIDYWKNEGDLTPEEANGLKYFFRFPTWFNLIDAVFFVVTSAEEAIKRDMSVSLTQKFGNTTNPATIQKLIDVFTTRHALEMLEPEKNDRVFLIDTSKMTRREMAEFILIKTLDALEKRFE